MKRRTISRRYAVECAGFPRVYGTGALAAIVRYLRKRRKPATAPQVAHAARVGVRAAQGWLRRLAAAKGQTPFAHVGFVIYNTGRSPAVAAWNPLAKAATVRRVSK